MSTYAYFETQLVEQLAIGRFASTTVLFKLLLALRCKCLFLQCIKISLRVCHADKLLILRCYPRPLG
jgi:hypothetical protein